MPYRWTPAPGFGTLELPSQAGKVYRPGDSVPISKGAAEMLVRAGHAFEGLGAAEPATAEPTPPSP